MSKLETLIADVLEGKRRAIARMLTIVENQQEGADVALSALYKHTGHAWIIGITGAPGTGKSSLVNALAKAYRQQSKTVAIIAVDPTSPFSGGAILGDRIRMLDLSGDKGVFIRSMATRGSLGGLAQMTKDAVRVMDAAGFDIVLVETVGAGQSEVDIVRTAHTTVVVEAPGLGDDIQSIKAGILEIADVLVVNKADRPGATRTASALKAMLELGHPSARNAFTTHHGHVMKAQTTVAESNDTMLWLPPVLKTVAVDGEGIEELRDTIEHHRNHLLEQGVLFELEETYLQMELYDRLRRELHNYLRKHVSDKQVQRLVYQIQSRQIDPQTAVNQLMTTLEVYSKHL